MNTTVHLHSPRLSVTAQAGHLSVTDWLAAGDFSAERYVNNPAGVAFDTIILRFGAETLVLNVLPGALSELCPVVAEAA